MLISQAFHALIDMGALVTGKLLREVAVSPLIDVNPSFYHLQA